jgi:large subunit ribosomal protein L10
MRPEKELLKQEVENKIKHYKSFVIMQYAALTANTANDFRREISKMGGEVEVLRKRILLKAAENAGVKLDLTALEGHIGLVFLGEDPIETTKAVFKFSQERDQVIKVRGGHFEGQIYGGEDMEKLSKLPGKDEMRAQLLSVFEAPMSHTLAVMDAILSSVVYCLDNKAKQESEAEETQQESGVEG